MDRLSKDKKNKGGMGKSSEEASEVQQGPGLDVAALPSELQAILRSGCHGLSKVDLGGESLESDFFSVAECKSTLDS